MKSVYEYLDYRSYLSDRLKGGGELKRGEMQRLAAAAQIHTSTLSLVFSGKRELTEEQALSTAKYFGMQQSEVRYFLRMVLYARAGNEALRALYRAEIVQMRTQASDLSKRLSVEKMLPDEQKAVFYSNWYYSAVRILTSVEGVTTPRQIAERLRIPLSTVENVLEFLVAQGLCIRRGNRVLPGPQSTHLEAGSPHIARHHANWRTRAMNAHPFLNPESELAYSGCLSLSRRDAVAVKDRLAAFIHEICDFTDPSPPEDAYCLNLDWYRL